MRADLRASALGVLLSACALAAVASPAPAPAAPLEGEGEDLELVANHELEGSATDLELAGDYAYVAFAGGMAIVDISDPRNPRRAGTFECSAGFGDIAIDPAATVAYLASDGDLGDCGDGQGTAIVDIRDKARPRQLSAITTATGSHTITLDGHVLSSNNYASNRVELYDVSNPREPEPLAQTTVPGRQAFHDSFFDHRPDGRVLLYAASIEAHDVLDVTDPASPRHLQRVTDPEVTISHQAEPNHSRDLIVVSDEWAGGAPAGACGEHPATAPLEPLPALGAAHDIGAIHFYRATPEGLFAGATGGAVKVGTFNLPVSAPEAGGCTSHVFWQAPDANRLVAGWYVKGTRVVDFSDPAAPRQLGWYVPEGADTWAAKPHRGYIFTGDLARGMDVLRFTGEGWPATAGPAEQQRRVQQGFWRAPEPPIRPPDEPREPPDQPDQRPPPRQPDAGGPRWGHVRLTLRVRVPGSRRRRVRLSASFVDGGGAVVARASAAARGRRAARLRFTGVAAAGRYRCVVRAGRRVLARASFDVQPAAGVAPRLGRVMVVRGRVLG